MTNFLEPAGWDAIVASCLKEASTRASAKISGCHPLRLRQVPEIHWLPNKPRSIDQIEPKVRLEIRRVIRGESPWPLSLLGPAGIGKTCVGLAVLDYSLGWYYTVAELCELLIQAQRNEIDVSTRRFWERMAKSSLVVLDELGARSQVSDHHYDAVKRLLDARENRPLIVISNHDLERLAQLYDDRIASRLSGGTVLNLAGKDRRLTHA